MSATVSMLIAVGIFIGTYILIITEVINKMLASLIGAFLLILTGILSQDIALRAIDWNVIFFLIGMMLVIAVLRRTGIFMYIAIKTAKLARGNPLLIMMLMFVVTAFSSAFLGSVTSIMILIPIILLICNELKITPVPYIITMVVASNMGGAATMIGDPPNIIIGSATDYDFLDFIFNLTPAIILATIACLGLMWVMYHGKLKVSRENRARMMSYKEEGLIKDKRMLKISLITVAVMLVLLALESTLKIGTASISMSAGLFLILVGQRNDIEHIMVHEVDWVTLFFFVGLFIIVEGLVQTGFISLLAHKVLELTHNQARPTSMAILWLSGILSAFIDNVPFVATMIPLIKQIGTVISQPNLMDPIWWSMSLGTCLGGNGTLIGASSNVVAIGITKKNGINISFMEFTKVSVAYTILSLVISSVYILIRYF
ncbi:MAG TPA: ArsB/NhaD family transporter [Candidatus Syntrophosphaera thermopropionivorans]|jgi:Na+/H+ antiporter NhaD/arsenite permease-like protein|nr:ArsB/NhaD family transporter [Candidatus Syntrophosphaera thermopropionivorans]HOQ82711.1 ArsB/NhaD family transporter [Candidatus Syntrophosphaera thermopropionivorans]HQK56952.1 ArsB/NhaD family transporter [Candidatus Syntrophosphaera thermopropionivorans]